MSANRFACFNDRHLLVTLEPPTPGLSAATPLTVDDINASVISSCGVPPETVPSGSSMNAKGLSEVGRWEYAGFDTATSDELLFTSGPT